MSEFKGLCVGGPLDGVMRVSNRERVIHVQFDAAHPLYHFSPSAMSETIDYTEHVYEYDEIKSYYKSDPIINGFFWHTSIDKERRISYLIEQYANKSQALNGREYEVIRK